MTDVRARLQASIGATYAIARELGKGGMAVVYLAHDVRHDRDVAIKVLHPDLGAALGAERFLSEIKTTAKLQHPHILPLLDSGEADGLLYYVMPVVTGETLRERLSREKQLPIEDALHIAREVADALGAAHALGIVHRDIKPENILLQGGHALVADFGIALAVQTAGGERMTQTGLSLGTPQYMSPEQATGERTIDARSDIYALGAVTYEMLAGDPPFTGSTVQAIVGKVLTEKPTSLHSLRDTVPASVEHAVLWALAKLPADRPPTAATFAAALGAGASTGTAATTPDRSHASPLARRTSVALAAVAVICAAAAILGWRRVISTPDAAVHRLEFTSDGGIRVAFPVLGTATQLALSPDGTRAVFMAEHSGGWILAIRNVEHLTAHVFRGTEGATYPEFSPNGRWIAFQGADGTLKKIASDGTSLTTLCSSSEAEGLAWLSDREIVFSTRAVPGVAMLRVSAEGGSPVPFSRLDTASGERYGRGPRAADDGKLVFYSSTKASLSDASIGVVTTRDGVSTVYPQLRGARPLGLLNGTLVYVRVDGALIAVPFNTRTLVAGTPIQVGDSVAVRNWDAAATLSSTGTLFYQEGGSAGQLVKVDTQGRASVLIDSVRSYVHPRFSPDGLRLAFEVTGPTGADIWTWDLESRALGRLTSGGVADRPEWTPDGTKIMYISLREMPYELWWQPVDGSAPATKVFVTADPIREGTFTPDGRAIVYRVDTRANNRDVFMVSLTAPRTVVPLLVSVNDEKQPRVSPDSRWLAYVSNESGREEVYVRPLAATAGRVQVSAGGGGEPLWAPTGLRLYYRTTDKMMEATLTTVPALGVSARRELFAGPYASDSWHPNYDVAPDGRSFVMIRPAQDSRRILMVVNWARELRRRMGTVR